MPLKEGSQEVDIQDDILRIKLKPIVLIATPSRLAMMVMKNILSLRLCSFLVIDEADKVVLNENLNIIM